MSLRQGQVHVGPIIWEDSPHHGRDPDPWDFGTENIPGLAQAGVRCRHMSGSQPVRYCSPPRRRPDAATWPTARDISQRAEPDVRPLGRAVSTFIAEKTRRLTIPLTGDVPLQHLMCPVHSAGRRRPSHPAGGVAVHSIAKQCAHAAKCTVPIHHHSYVAREASPARQYYVDRGYQGARKIALGMSISRSKYYICYVPGPTCRGSAPFYVPPFSYKRGGIQRYNTSC